MNVHSFAFSLTFLNQRIRIHIGSARVLKKIGMRPEGRQREKAFIKGRWDDHLLYAILDRDGTGVSEKES